MSDEPNTYYESDTRLYRVFSAELGDYVNIYDKQGNWLRSFPVWKEDFHSNE